MADPEKFMSPEDQKKAVDAAFQLIADYVGIEDGRHTPGTRGVDGFLEDCRRAVENIPDGRRHSLMVIRRTDFEAILGAIKCAAIAKQVVVRKK